MRNVFCRSLAPAAALLLASCATYSGEPSVAPAGSAVALHQPVAAGDRVLTPLALVEDSRCPQGVQCIWAGRVVVTTLVGGPEGRETLDLIAGEEQRAMGATVLLAEVMPQRKEAAIPPGDYRFSYVISQ